MLSKMILLKIQEFSILYQKFLKCTFLNGNKAIAIFLENYYSPMFQEMSYYFIFIYDKGDF